MTSANIAMVAIVPIDEVVSRRDSVMSFRFLRMKRNHHRDGKYAS